ncbi:MAG: hypothetical protein F4205_02125 [Gemmatimonadetes bacterium]|nr:hypothetical protein [Gemmatimonadota bacterium]MXX73577.1 hypothetical protein [Gemmatimonadota bacterium]MYC92796.1 hypothetical protein [Gemmatimonadota bacterium]MYG34266.1 hypothetical protein [Gemmatimonadota bacterium]
MKRSEPGNRGFAIAEAVVGCTLLLLLVQVAWGITAVQATLAGRIVGESLVLDEARLVHHLLVAEVGQGLGRIDWSVYGDALQLRAFRGVGLKCRTQPNAGWGVAVSGYRAPDPDKDSVLVFSETSGWQLSRLQRRTRGSGLDCQQIPGFAIEEWTLDPPHPDAVAALYFERGAYRFSAGAFRYRVGNGGWQPLTSTGIASDSASLVADGANDLSARVVWDDAALPSRTLSWTVRGAR